jgi:hypothetical protein
VLHVASNAVNPTVGSGLTATTTASEVDVQLNSFATVTVYESAVEAVIDTPVAPVDHVFPPSAELVKTTDSPSQKVNGPLAEIVGTDGNGLTVTLIASEVAEQPEPSVIVTVNVPLALTVIDCVVAPFDQVFPVVSELVNTTSSPSQTVVAPLAVTTGAAGALGSEMDCDNVLDVHPEALVKVTVYDPAANCVIVYGKLIPLSFPAAVPVQEMFPEPDPDISKLPVAVQHVVGWFTDPSVITGIASTVTISFAEVAVHPFTSSTTTE